MKTYNLAIRSFNVTTNIKVELTKSELELLQDISKSLLDQKASNWIEVTDGKD